MRGFELLFKCIMAAALATAAPAGLGRAQDADIDALLEQLASPDTANWRQIERQIKEEWSKSGSPAMDLLQQRGRKAMDEDDYDAALEHFTALTDHAPEFAEGWNLLAAAYFRKNLHGPAMDAVARALALNPRHFEAMAGLAVILQHTGYFKDALEAWRLVEEVHPHRPELKQAIELLEAEVGGRPL